MRNKSSRRGTASTWGERSAACSPTLRSLASLPFPVPLPPPPGCRVTFLINYLPHIFVLHRQKVTGEERQFASLAF